MLLQIEMQAKLVSALLHRHQKCEIVQVKDGIKKHENDTVGVCDGKKTLLSVCRSPFPVDGDANKHKNTLRESNTNTRAEK